MTGKNPLDYLSPQPPAPPPPRSPVAAALRMIAMAILFFAGVYLAAASNAFPSSDGRALFGLIGAMTMFVSSVFFAVTFATAPR